MRLRLAPPLLPLPLPLAPGYLQCISLLAHLKYDITRYLLARVNMGVAWVFNMAVTTVMVAASSFAVVGWAPEAQGSGIPEVMAYLNGCMVSKVRAREGGRVEGKGRGWECSAECKETKGGLRTCGR